MWRLAVVIVTIFCSSVHAQDAENVEMVGRCLVHWDNARHIVIDGDLAYIATVSSGLQIVDISDQRNPAVVGFLDSVYLPENIIISNEYLYAALGVSGIVIISISDPENPEEVGRLETTAGAYGLSLSGNYCYVVGRCDMSVVSIEDPDNPEEIGYLETFIYANDIKIVDNNAYILGVEGLQVFSINDPENPEVLGTCLFRSAGLSMAVSGNYAYVAGSVFGVIAVSIEDPEHPEVLGRFEAKSEIMDVDVFGEYTCVTDIDSGLYIVSFNDPANPTEIGYCQIDVPSINVAVSEDHAIITNGANGMRVISLNDPENPEEIGSYNTVGHVVGITVSEDYAYVAYGEGGLRVISTSDHENPEEVGRIDTDGFAESVAVSGDYAYVADGRSGLSVISIADPGNLREVGHFYYRGLFRANDVVVSQGYAYVTDGRGLLVISVTNPERPVGIVHYIPRDAGSFECVAILGDHLLVGESPVWIPDFPNDREQGGGLRIISVADPENPEEIGYYPHGSWVSDIKVSGEIVYLIAPNRGGLLIYSLTEDGDANRVAEYTWQGGARFYSVAITESYAVLAWSNMGLYVLSIADPAHPEAFGYFNTHGSALDVAMSDNGLIYVADATNLGIYRFTPESVSDDPSNLASNFTLFASYPNPFNSTTTISYTLPSPARVNISIYDISGKLIETLYNDFQQAGEWSTTLNGSDLTSGIYFVRMNASEVQLSQKVLLIN